MGQLAQLQIGGRNYQVVSSASQDELDRLAQRVEQALETVGGVGSLRADRGLLLAALRLAHDAQAAEEARLAERHHYKQQLSRYIGQLNQILGIKPTALSNRKSPPRKFEVQSIQPETPNTTTPQALETQAKLGDNSHFEETDLKNPWGEVSHTQLPIAPRATRIESKKGET